MYPSKTTSILGALALASSAAAHGVVTGFTVDNVAYTGYQPYFQYESKVPVVAGWSIPDDGNLGYIAPSNYSTPDAICHTGATPGQGYVKIQAGGSITLQWTNWPTSHHGPVIDYLANCHGPCTMVDKTTLKFNKIDQRGLISWDTQPGFWAADQLIAAQNTWTITIPESIAPGNYVLRHEIIALHAANQPDGAQNYPQCVNLQITGAGTDSLVSGTPGTQLYSPTDPGILVDIYSKLNNYQIPGPVLYAGAVRGGSSTGNGNSSALGNPPFPTSTAYPNATSSAGAIPMPTGGFTSTPAGPEPTKSKKPCSVQHTVTIITQSTSTVTADPTRTSSPAGAPASIPTPTATPVSNPETPIIITPVGKGPDKGTNPDKGTTGSTGSTSTTTIGPPPGLTLEQLLTWLEIVLKDLIKQDGGSTKVASLQRRHAREFQVLREMWGREE